MLPNIDMLRKEITYDPETGQLRWLKPGQGRRLSGVAGCEAEGYRNVMVNGWALPAHRLAFALMTGRWPEAEVDHINGDGLDNRWVNLREASRQQNAQNVHKPRRSNKLGLLGVSTGPRLADGTRNYIAQIQHAGRRMYLGTFRTPEEAHEAYLEAKRRLHGYNTL